MTAIIPVLVACLSAVPTADNNPIEPQAVRQSVEKALPLILKSTEEYPMSRDCFSCHHQAVPALALSISREKGFAVPDDAVAALVEHTEADLRTALDSYRKGTGQAGGVTRAGYALFTLEIGGQQHNEITDAVVKYLLKRDENRNHWHTSSNRPPSEASDFTSTYLALRALEAYGQEEQTDRIKARVRKTREWLEAASPMDNEDRVFRLMALKASKAPEKTVQEASDALVATRHENGGWSQIDGADSDAYATGSALVALHQAGGMPTEDPVYQAGLRFLIDNQRDDGSWFVKSRSKPFQPYFESGFPYGNNQFISMAASSWAISALSLACPKN